MDETERRTLALVRDYLNTGEARLYEHLSSTFRWLMATLFAANGGAIIALLGSARHAHVQELGWFAAGLLLSILMGVLSSLWSMVGVNRILKARTSIDQSLLLTNEVDHGVLDELVTGSKLNWKTWVPTYVGVASFACLSAGMIAIACNL